MSVHFSPILRSVCVCLRVSEYAESVLVADGGFVVYMSFHRNVYCHLSRSVLTLTQLLLLGMRDFTRKNSMFCSERWETTSRFNADLKEE